MKKSIAFALTGLLLFLLSGCAAVKFYSNPELTEKSGLKYYTVKPYVQVERDVASERIVKATVVYLPDLSNPQYLVVKDGPGSRKLDLKLTEGTISTIGITTDPQIAESIDALAALVSKSADAVADLSTLKGRPEAAAVSTVTELYEVIMSPDGTSMKKIEF